MVFRVPAPRPAAFAAPGGARRPAARVLARRPALRVPARRPARVLAGRPARARRPVAAAAAGFLEQIR